MEFIRWVEQRVVDFRRRLGDGLAGSVGELVAFSHDKIVEGVLRVKDLFLHVARIQVKDIGRTILILEDAVRLAVFAAALDDDPVIETRHLLETAFDHVKITLQDVRVEILRRLQIGDRRVVVDLPHDDGLKKGLEGGGRQLGLKILHHLAPKICVVHQMGSLYRTRIIVINKLS